MIYDCFIFFNELELLELRLIELTDIVDIFVIVESTKTFTGMPKKLNYLENKELYKNFNHKIIHVIVDDMPKQVGNVKDREIFLRNAVIRGLKNCQDEDIIMLSDVDEIPNKNIIKGILESQKEDLLICLRMPMFYYYYNCLMINENWFGTLITKYKIFKTQEAQWFRNNRMTVASINEAGWHFSYLYGIDRIIEKIQNFGDPIDPTDIKKASRPEWLKKCINEFIDLYDNRNAKLKIIPLDSSFPETIYKNKSKYPIISTI